MPSRRQTSSPQAGAARRIRVSSVRPSIAANTNNNHSRLAAPRASAVPHTGNGNGNGNSHEEDEESTVMTGMDVDDGRSVLSDSRGTGGGLQKPTQVVFAKSDELSVSFYANLPVEVKQVLKNAGELSFG